MGRALSRQRKKANRKAQAAVKAAEQSIRAAAAADAALALAKEMVTDVSALRVSVAEVEAAGTASEELRWFIARCEPMSERKTIDGLKERRITAYIPLERRYHWSKGRKRLIERPLFVGYLFVGLWFLNDRPARQTFHDVERVSGISGMVEVGGKRAQIDPWSLLQIAALESAGLFDHTEKKKPAYSAEQLIRVIGGPFAEAMGKVIDISGDRVRVQLVGTYKGRMDIKADQIAAVEDQEAA